jgi:hypothetical protein
VVPQRSLERDNCSRSDDLLPQTRGIIPLHDEFFSRMSEGAAVATWQWMTKRLRASHMRGRSSRRSDHRTARMMARSTV